MKKSLSSFALAAALSFLVYANSLPNDFVGDDTGIVRDNPYTKGLGNAGTILRSSWWAPFDDGEDTLYRPLPILSFALDHDAWGGGATASRAVNIGLHALVSWLVWILARRLLGRGPAAWLALGLFALHPVHVEAVTGLVGRAELLMALFALLALLSHLKARGGSLAASLAAPLLLGAALLCKETAVAVPLMAAGLDLHERGRGRAPRLAYAGYLAVLAGVLVLRRAVLGANWLGGTLPAFLPENPLQQASVVERLLTAPDLLRRYALLLVLPLRLSADYSFNQIPVLSTPASLAALGGMATAAVLAAALAASFRRRGFVFPGLALALLPLAPVLNVVVPTGTIFAERLLYLPSAGFAVLAGAWLAAWHRHVGHRALAWALPVLVLGFHAVRTPLRNRDWRNELTLFQATAEASPRSAKAWFDLGNASAKVTPPLSQKALNAYRKALEIKPDFHEARRRMGWVYEIERLEDMALQEYRRILEADPERGEVWAGLGRLLLRMGAKAPPGAERDRALEEAEAALGKALYRAPRPAERAATLIELGRLAFERMRPLLATIPEVNDPKLSPWLDMGRRCFHEALATLPGNEGAKLGLCELEVFAGDPALGLAIAEELLAVHPDHKGLEGHRTVAKARLKRAAIMTPPEEAPKEEGK